jgi:hypothetical protein
MQSIHATQAIKAPAYHMRMKDLVAKQRTAYQSLRTSYAVLDHSARRAMEHLKKVRTEFRKTYRAGLVALLIKQNEEKAALRQQHHDARQREKEKKAARRQQKYDARQQAKVEKAFIAESRKEADFWTYYPNHEGRRDTMVLVLKSLSQPVMPLEQMDKLMPAYAEWLLTSTHGRKCRWSLMTAFVTERLVV